MKKFIFIAKDAAILFCSLFTVGTLANSIGYLYLGIETNPDVHGHIIGRAVIMLVVTIVITLAVNISNKIKEKRESTEKSTNLPKEDAKAKESSLIVYSVIWGGVLLLVTVFLWALTSGYLWLSRDEFSPHSLWHLFRSIVIPGFAVAAIGFFIKLKCRNKKPDSDDTD